MVSEGNARHQNGVQNGAPLQEVQRCIGSLQRRGDYPRGEWDDFFRREQG